MGDGEEEEVRRLTALLAALVEISGRSHRSIERQLGLSSAGLGKILRGAVKVQVSHLLRILDALDLDPADFFHKAYPYPGRSRNRVLLEKLEAIARGPGERIEEGAPELDERVKQAFLRILGSGPAAG